MDGMFWIAYAMLAGGALGVSGLLIGLVAARGLVSILPPLRHLMPRPPPFSRR